MGFDLEFFNIICMNSVCKIMPHILVFIVNLDFAMLIKLFSIKDLRENSLKIIRGGGMSFGGRFLKRKLTLFFF